MNETDFYNYTLKVPSQMEVVTVSNLRKLIELFLSVYSRYSRSQLLFTTHDVLLMDQNLLRRDEMWVTERKKDGSSHLFSFSEYKDIRYDKNIRKSYILGRLGGIPRILVNDAFLSRKKA